MKLACCSEVCQMNDSRTCLKWGVQHSHKYGVLTLSCFMTYVLVKYRNTLFCFVSCSPCRFILLIIANSRLSFPEFSRVFVIISFTLCVPRCCVSIKSEQSLHQVWFNPAEKQSMLLGGWGGDVTFFLQTQIPHSGHRFDPNIWQKQPAAH